ncbi:MAG: hypothetical protein J6K45_08065 [Clostridia bacterium]|nr:hypothetical protein [Clostridia bacterium]
MGNKNVFYIDYLDSYLDVLNASFPKWFRKLIYIILNHCGVIRKNENIFILMSVEDGNINKRMICNLQKKLLKSNVQNIVFAESLYNRREFIEFFKNRFNILEGKWLYKFLILDIIKKIVYIQGRNISDYEITILCNKPSEIVLDNIKFIARNCKILNIVTENIDEFSYLEDELYDKFGILLIVSSNVKKACLHSDIIINIDFLSTQLNMCRFKDDNILIQCTKEKFDNRNGLVITNYKFDILKRYLSFWTKMKHFELEILYESLLYYNTSFSGVRKILKRDNVKIKYLEGLHGKLNFREIKK